MLDRQGEREEKRARDSRPCDNWMCGSLTSMPIALCHEAFIYLISNTNEFLKRGISVVFAFLFFLF